MCERGFVWAVQPEPKLQGHVGGTPGSSWAQVHFPPSQAKQTESGLETAALAPSAHPNCPPWADSCDKRITPVSTS